MVSEGTTYLAGDEEYVIDALKLYIYPYRHCRDNQNRHNKQSSSLFFFFFWGGGSIFQEIFPTSRAKAITEILNTIFQWIKLVNSTTQYFEILQSLHETSVQIKFWLQFFLAFLSTLIFLSQKGPLSKWKTPIWYYSKMWSNLVVKKILVPTPWDLH